MAKRGPKSGFNDAIQSTVLALIKEGKTEEQIAEVIGVSRTTLNNWKGVFPEFLYAVRKSRQMADELVEAALFNRAVGYSHPEEKVFCSEGSIVTHDTVKHFPPDTTAAMFWLRNRQPEKWREKTDGDVNVTNTTNVTALSDSDLDAKIQKLMEKANPGKEEA